VPRLVSRAILLLPLRLRNAQKENFTFTFAFYDTLILTYKGKATLIQAYLKLWEV
jgi:hypothetical protein